MKLLIPLMALIPLAQAQYYVISTVAGNGQVQFSDGGGAATSARLIAPNYTAADGAGNVFVSDNYYHQVFQISAAGTITVAAGTGKQGFSGDGGRATAAQLDGPAGLAVDSAGNLYIADSANNRIRRVGRDGNITTYAGNGQGGVGGDGGAAAAAQLGGVTGLAVDGAGDLYFSQPSSHRVRRVRADGAVSRFAGTGTAGFSGDGGAAASAQLFNPQGLKVDRQGNVYIADNQNHRIRKVPASGTISTVVGNGTQRFAGDGAAAELASLSGPADVAIDANNNLYISDLLNGRVRMVNAAGVISTVAGGGGALQNGPALQASLPAPTGLAIDSEGRLIIGVNFARQVRRLSQLTITTIAGVPPTGGAGDDTPATAATLLSPFGVAVDGAGNVLVSDQVDNRIRKVSPAGVIATFGGTGLYGWNGDGSPATTAAIGSPRGLSFDTSGNLFLVSGAMSGVRRIAATGSVSTIAGTGAAGFTGDGGVATEARLNIPLGVAVDAAGNTFVADTNNHRIRRVDGATRVITTFAGTGIAGFSGDNGPAAQAQLFQPRQLTFDSGGNLFIADTGNSRVRRIGPSGVITTVAGTGVNGASGDGGPATAAQLSAVGVAVDRTGNLFVVGTGRIRKVDGATGIISTIAGNGTLGFSGDGGLGTSAMIDGAVSAAVDAQGVVYFTDERNARVRKLTPAQIVAEGVANAGTLKAGAVAPGEVISIFGFEVGPAVPAGLQVDAAGVVTTQLGGTRVLFDDVPAPLVYVSSGQVNAIVPYGVAGKDSTRMQVIFQGRATNTITLPVVAASPGVFAITNEDGSVNSAANPAAQGSILVIYGTGEGQTAPGGVDGSVARTVFPKPVLPVSVLAGGQAAEVLYAGAAPDFVAGVMQVNLRIPAGLRGTLPLQLRIGEATTPAGLNIFVRAQ